MRCGRRARCTCIPRLAREVLYQVYNSTVNISSLYRAVDKENKRRRAYNLVSTSLQELNDLVREHGGTSIITSCPDLWEIDVTVREHHAAPL